MVMQMILQAILGDREDFLLAGKLSTAAEALAFLETERVDIILLDHEMPGMKGLEALPAIVAAAPGARVVMLSSFCDRGSEIAVSALSQGASEAIPKPSGGQGLGSFSASLVWRLRRLAAERHHQPERGASFICRAFPAGARPACLGIGASTGGIHALQDFFAGLGGGIGVPILITQHLPEAFIPHYRAQVGRMSGLPAMIAEPGMMLRPDHVYIAPGDHSLGCERDGTGAVRLTLVPGRDPVTQARPSVNVMFASLARTFGAGAMAAVLTGMGRDGTAGASRIVDAGGAVIAQDPESSVVWGMPGSVTRAGLACATMRPQAMASYLLARMEPGAL